MTEPFFAEMKTAEPERVAEELPKLVRDLKRLEAAVAEGRRLAVEALKEFADPDGLLELVDADCLSDSSLGLRAWLTDLQAAVRAGRTDDVAYGISRWQKLAGDVEQMAMQLKAANAKPKAYWSELRGRLSSQQAKAVDLGLAEDEQLSALHSRARAVLRGKPVDLRLAEQYVHAYEEAVNGRTEGGRGMERKTAR